MIDQHRQRNDLLLQHQARGGKLMRDAFHTAVPTDRAA